jgi:hypothetical protein
MLVQDFVRQETQKISQKNTVLQIRLWKEWFSDNIDATLNIERLSRDSLVPNITQQLRNHLGSSTINPNEYPSLDIFDFQENIILLNNKNENSHILSRREFIIYYFYYISNQNNENIEFRNKLNQRFQRLIGDPTQIVTRLKIMFPFNQRNQFKNSRITFELIKSKFYDFKFKTKSLKRKLNDYRKNTFENIVEFWKEWSQRKNVQLEDDYENEEELIHDLFRKFIFHTLNQNDIPEPRFALNTQDNFEVKFKECMKILSMKMRSIPNITSETKFKHFYISMKTFFQKYSSAPFVSLDTYLNSSDKIIPIKLLIGQLKIPITKLSEIEFVKFKKPKLNVQEGFNEKFQELNNMTIDSTQYFVQSSILKTWNAFLRNFGMNEQSDISKIQNQVGELRIDLEDLILNDIQLVPISQLETFDEFKQLFLHKLNFWMSFLTTKHQNVNISKSLYETGHKFLTDYNSSNASSFVYELFTNDTNNIGKQLWGNILYTYMKHVQMDIIHFKSMHIEVIVCKYKYGDFDNYRTVFGVEYERLANHFRNNDANIELSLLKSFSVFINQEILVNEIEPMVADAIGHIKDLKNIFPQCVFDTVAPENFWRQQNGNSFIVPNVPMDNELKTLLESIIRLSPRQQKFNTNVNLEHILEYLNENSFPCLEESIRQVLNIKYPDKEIEYLIPHMIKYQKKKCFINSTNVMRFLSGIPFVEKDMNETFELTDSVLNRNSNLSFSSELLTFEYESQHFEELTQKFHQEVSNDLIVKTQRIETIETELNRIDSEENSKENFENFIELTKELFSLNEQTNSSNEFEMSSEQFQNMLCYIFRRYIVSVSNANFIRLSIKSIIVSKYPQMNQVKFIEFDQQDDFLQDLFMLFSQYFFGNILHQTNISVCWNENQKEISNVKNFKIYIGRKFLEHYFEDEQTTGYSMNGNIMIDALDIIMFYLENSISEIAKEMCKDMLSKEMCKNISTSIFRRKFRDANNLHAISHVQVEEIKNARNTILELIHENRVSAFRIPEDTLVGHFSSDNVILVGRMKSGQMKVNSILYESESFAVLDQNLVLKSKICNDFFMNLIPGMRFKTKNILFEFIQFKSNRIFIAKNVETNEQKEFSLIHHQQFEIQ